jgi:hypothetical protein
MAYSGIKVHKKQSQMCFLTTAGEILPQRIPTHGAAPGGLDLAQHGARCGGGLRQSHAI